GSRGHSFFCDVARGKTQSYSDNPGQEKGVRWDIEVEIRQAVDSDSRKSAGASQAEKSCVPILAGCCANGCCCGSQKKPAKDEKSHNTEFACQFEIVIM